MVTPNVDQLKSDAFKLSRILAAYKVKLSSQQALDALSRLYWNVPYEALRTTTESPGAMPSSGSPPAGNTLSDWLSVGTAFCDVLRTLDSEAVNQAAWNGHEVPSTGLHRDAERYLRAAGVATDRFSRTARDFVRSHPQMRDLTCIVEAGNPIVSGVLAVLRIQFHEPGAAAAPGFVGSGLLQDECEDFLFGAEARIELVTGDSNDKPDRDRPYDLTPSVRLTYRVSGQPALKAFGSILKQHILQGVWHGFGHLNVYSRILLTKNNTQDSIEDDWLTDQDPDGKRLLAFCYKASKLTDEETCDWPPYVELSRKLDSSNTEQELKRYSMNLSAHALCLTGGGTGWREIRKTLPGRDS